MDNTDRNRTSPFAFTGNKFELRAVGSSANTASSMIVLNTIVANQLVEFKNDLDAKIKKGEKKEVAIINILRDYIKKSKAIRFEGNGYSDEWEKEAKKRGLSNVKNTVEALDAFLTEKSKDLFIKNGIFNEVELEARIEIQWENYNKNIQIESRVMGDLAMNHVIPTAITYQNKLITNVKGLKDIGLNPEDSGVIDTIKEISGHIKIIRNNVHDMVEARKVANKIENARERAQKYAFDVKGYFDEIRYHVDKLELLVDDEDWPLAKNRELMFLR